MKRALIVGFSMFSAVIVYTGRMHLMQATAITDVDRVVRYRAAGSASDGVHALMDRVKIEKRDYDLMGADNSCAMIRSGGKTYEEVTEGRWFAVSRDWKDQPFFPNSHGSSDDGGKTFYTETAFMSIPRPEYQVTPQEVVWHRLRVDELKAQGVEQPERMRIMDAERKQEPWTR